MTPERLGPYRLVRALASGGMGTVHEAVHEPTGARHALKTLHGAAALSAEDLARFRREVEVLARLDHPHVVRIHAADVDGRIAWLAQDLLPGGSLQTRLERQGPLPVDEALAIARKLAGALAHVHAQGVLHRDVKPHNVLFDDRGEPRLVDFGLARRIDGASRLTETGTILGSPQFMAPEQADGRPLDARTDVYGLGATLWASLAGRPPFEGETVWAVLDRTLKGRVGAPSALRPDVPPWLDAVVLRAIANDPGARFPSVEALREALQARRPSRGRSVVALGVTAALSVGLACAAAVLLVRQDPLMPSAAPTEVGRSTEPRPPSTTSDSTEPAWFAALAQEQRPALPVNVKAGEQEGEYVLEGDGSILVWIPPLDDEPGFFMGKYEVSIGQLQRARADLDVGEADLLLDTLLANLELPAVGLDGSVARRYCVRVRASLPTVKQWARAAGGDVQLVNLAECNLERPDSPRHPLARLRSVRLAGWTSPAGCVGLVGNAQEWALDGGEVVPVGGGVTTKVGTIHDRGFPHRKRNEGASEKSGWDVGFRVAVNP